MSGPTSDSASQLRNDYRRLAALRAYEILDTPPDPMLDLLSRVTAELLDVPFACVSLVDEHRVFLKSAHGLSSGNLGPEPGLCVTAVETNQTRHIEHLLSDPLTADHPVVAGPPNVRSYAGTPLRTPDRLPIGTLCVMDVEPRSFTSEQLALLERLGGLVMDQIEATLATDPRKRRAADRYEAIASRLIVPPPIGVLVVDPDGGLMFVNDAARSMLNPTPGEGMAELLNRICEDDPAALLEVLGESDTSDTEATIQGRTADGELGPLSWQMERSNDGHSTNRIMVSVRPAVTEPEYVEAVLEAQKLESLGVLAGGVAHDLNNILGAIMGNTGLARDSLENPNRLVRYLATIDQATDRASALCEQLLVYAGGGQFSIRSTDLSQLIAAVSALLQATMPKKAVMNLGLSDALPSTDCDPEQLQHVLFNLVANASEALPEGVGSVSLSTGSIHLSTEELDRLVLGDGLSPGDFVWLEVADNGCGMEPDATRLIFDPFYTTKPHGHGLGMAAVLGIIRSHGGAISVKSTVGSGTTIRLYLPASRRPATTPEPPEPAPIGRSECLTVLVVDDEAGIRDALTDILSQNGHRVLSAADGVIGTQLIDAHPGEIDVAIIDLTMPNMDGSELYDEIRRRDDSMKVIFSSGYIQSASTRPITDAGLARFLKKPYRASALLAELEQFAAVPRSDSTNSSSASHI